jgi:hypothetical protein
MFWNQTAPEHATRVPACAAKISTPLHGYHPRLFQRRTRGERRLHDARAGTEVETVSKMYLKNLEQIDKNPPKCVQTRDPQTRDQIPKRSAKEQRAGSQCQCQWVVAWPNANAANSSRCRAPGLLLWTNPMPSPMRLHAVPCGPMRPRAPGGFPLGPQRAAEYRAWLGEDMRTAVRAVLGGQGKFLRGGTSMAGSGCQCQWVVGVLSK